MTIRKFILHIIILLATCLQTHAQAYAFRHYEVESGLSNNAVICSTQDKAGFMWFGTRDGLNRFDGYAFKTYRFPVNNFIHALHVDAAGTLYAGTENHIYKYNPKSDSFSLLVSAKSAPVDDILSDAEGNLWFNAGGILSFYSAKSRTLQTFDPGKYFSITGICFDRRGTLWASTPDGFLKKYDKASGTFTGYDLFSHTNASAWRYVSGIEYTADDKILISTSKAGIKIFDVATTAYQDIALCCVEANDLFVHCILQISPQEIWIGTETGIFSYNTKTGASFKIQKKNGDGYALSDNVIYTLYKDREGGLWVGTYFGGINYLPRQYTPFHKFYQQSSDTPLSGNIVREITKDNYGNLWISIEDGGLNKINLKTGAYACYKPNGSKTGISYIGVHSLLAVDDELWVGSFEHGLDILDIKTGNVVRHYEATSPNGFRSNFPFCFHKTSDGQLLLGSFPGIYSYNKTGDYFSPLPGFPAGGNYKYILKDRGGTIWAAASGMGVLYSDTKTGKSGGYTYNAANRNGICSNMVNSIFEDSSGTLWFATENGLCRLNRAKGSFTRYGTGNGLPSNFILAVLEDNQKRLWVSTTKGLACFNPKDGKTTVYTTANGLLSDQFNFSSAYKDSDGRMYFGSAKGLISFNPDDFAQDTYIPPVFVTGLQIDNKEVTTGSKGSPLTEAIINTKKITLKHNQSTISLDFAALGYTAPENLKYAYKLDGLSNKWTYITGNRKVYFTKLEPGEYTFRVKAASSGGIWGGNETRLGITVLPPWWASLWAFGAYLVLAVLCAYAALRYYHRRVQEKNRRNIERLELANQKELLQVEIAKEKEILESKIEFYTQVAHEIKTPLTLIKIPLGKVIRKTEGITEIANSLKIIGGNTDRLIELSNQLLDFRQTELKAYSLRFAEENISELIADAHLNFLALAEQANISLTLEMPDEDLCAYVDTDAFTKIIYNLLSNAVKYAATTVQVVLLPYHKSNTSFTLLIKNDGYLIPENLADKIFEPFFRIKETETKTGSGIGLALARSIALTHKGTLVLERREGNKNVFSLTLPIYNTQ